MTFIDLSSYDYVCNKKIMSNFNKLLSGSESFDGLTIARSLVRSIGLTLIDSENFNIVDNSAVVDIISCNRSSGSIWNVSITSGSLFVGSGRSVGLNLASTTEFNIIDDSGSINMLQFNRVSSVWDAVFSNSVSVPNGNIEVGSGFIAIADGMTAPGAGTGVARIYVDNSDGDLKVVFADGTVKTLAIDT